MKESSVEVAEASPASGAFSLERYPPVPEQSVCHSCQTEEFQRSPAPDPPWTGERRRDAAILEGDTGTHVQLLTGKTILIRLQSLHQKYERGPALCLTAASVSMSV